MNISQPSLLNMQHHLRQPQCPDLSNGYITLNTTGGVPPYRYTWNNATQTSFVVNANDGVYTVEVEDNNQCKIRDTISLQSVMTTHLIQTQPILCYGNSTATLYANICGGKLPYKYCWNTGDTTAMIRNAPVGAYICRTEDALGTVHSDTITIAQPAKLHIGFEMISPSCDEASDGQVFAVATGGVSPYSYLWNTGSRDDRINRVSKGVYSVTIKDQNACEYQQSALLSAPAPLRIDFTVQQPSCYDYQNGKIIAHPSGGTPTYTLKWSNNEHNTDTLCNVGYGYYGISFSDSKNCSAMETIFVDQPLQIQFDVPRKHILCSGQYAEVTTSVDSLQYIWYTEGGEVLTGQTVQLSKAGLYTVVGFDHNGCFNNDSVLVIRRTDTLEAVFWINTEVYTGTTYIITNISQYKTDSALWSATQAAQILYEDPEYLHLFFADTGRYDIGLSTFVNGCRSSALRSIYAIDGTNQDRKSVV
jgi:hypothetical protein